MDFDFKPIINANLKWVARVSNRWTAAALALNAGSYHAKHFARDLAASLFGDPNQWIMDIAHESDTSRIIIPVQGVDRGVSRLIPVADSFGAQITSLVRLGGSEEMRSSGADIQCILDKPSLGVVQVKLQVLTSAKQPPGIYLGFIFSKDGIIATVVALR